MKKAWWKWKRVRPGLYYAIDDDGHCRGLIERGAETTRWWWEIGERCGWSPSLREAKDDAR